MNVSLFTDWNASKVSPAALCQRCNLRNEELSKGTLRAFSIRFLGCQRYLCILISAPTIHPVCVTHRPGVIETGPLLYRHQRVSNESISLTARHPGGPSDHDYQCITDECFWIENAICHHIWVYVYQLGEPGNSRAGTPVCCFWWIKATSHHTSHLSRFLHVLRVTCVWFKSAYVKSPQDMNDLHRSHAHAVY